MPWLNQLAAWIQQVVVPWGGWGLAPAAFLDSSFLSLAGGVDFWLISLIIFSPAQTPTYVAIATLGSVAGASALYFAVLKGEEAFLRNPGTLARLEQIRQRIERSGFGALILASVLPPPTPFKLFLIGAGVVRYPFFRFLLAISLGRLLRYTVLGTLAALYGRRSWELLVRLGPWIFGVFLVAAALLYLGFRLRRKTSLLQS